MEASSEHIPPDDDESWIHIGPVGILNPKILISIYPYKIHHLIGEEKCTTVEVETLYSKTYEEEEAIPIYPPFKRTVWHRGLIRKIRYYYTKLIDLENRQKVFCVTKILVIQYY